MTDEGRISQVLAGLDTLKLKIDALEEKTSKEHARWWHTWFSPATVALLFTTVGVVWTTSGRLTSTEKDVATVQSRVTTLETSAVTKEWLTRELQFQREMLGGYASKSSVDLISQRLEEFQRQLNSIDASIRTLGSQRPK